MILPGVAAPNLRAADRPGSPPRARGRHLPGASHPVAREPLRLAAGALRVDREPLSRLRDGLPLLLRRLHPRVPGPGGGGQLPLDDLREDGRRGRNHADPGPDRPARRAGRPGHRHRPLPARGGRPEGHPALPRAGREAPRPAHRHHHQGGGDPARHRSPPEDPRALPALRAGVAQLAADRPPAQARAVGAPARGAPRSAAAPRGGRPSGGSLPVPHPARPHRWRGRPRRAHRPGGRRGGQAHVGEPALPALAHPREVLRLPGPGVPALPGGLPARLRGAQLPRGPLPQAHRGPGAAAAGEARARARGLGGGGGLCSAPRQLGLFEGDPDGREPRATFGYRLLS